MNEMVFPLCIVHFTTFTTPSAHNIHTHRARFVSEPFKKKIVLMKEKRMSRMESKGFRLLFFPSSFDFRFVCSGFSVDLFTLAQQAIARFLFSFCCCFRWIVLHIVYEKILKRLKMLCCCCCCCGFVEFSVMANNDK